jgi:hypothetical protein
MANLPQQLDWDLAQNKWASQLNPVLANPLVNGRLLTNIPLVTGTNVIDHKLGRKLQGWFIVGINGIAEVYDNQAANQTPALTLVLISNAAVSCNVWVF